MRRSARRCGGFTLLEVLVAMAIFATAAVALVKSVSGSALNMEALEVRQFAGLVAHNRMVQTQLRSGEDGDVGVVEMGGRRFRWQRAVQDTDTPAIVRVEIAVSLEEGKDTLATLVGFMAAEEKSP